MVVRTGEVLIFEPIVFVKAGNDILGKLSTVVTAVRAPGYGTLYLRSVSLGLTVP